jgi:hypothetical protein
MKHENKTDRSGRMPSFGKLRVFIVRTDILVMISSIFRMISLYTHIARIIPLVDLVMRQ